MQLMPLVLWKVCMNILKLQYPVPWKCSILRPDCNLIFLAFRKSSFEIPVQRLVADQETRLREMSRWTIHTRALRLKKALLAMSPSLEIGSSEDALIADILYHSNSNNWALYIGTSRNPCLPSSMITPKSPTFMTLRLWHVDISLLCWKHQTQT